MKITINSNEIYRAIANEIKIDLDYEHLNLSSQMMVDKDVLQPIKSHITKLDLYESVKVPCLKTVAKRSNKSIQEKLNYIKKTATYIY